jgi:AraC-like DNA-binding protein
MSDILHLKSISDLYKFLNLGYAEHPLIAVVDFTKVIEHTKDEIRIKTDFYSIMFKNYCRNHIRYGRKTLDFQDGSLVCIAPNHVITIDNDIEVKEDMMGWGLFFHPDLIRGTSLGAKMKDFSFFSYETSEALHLSDKEKQLLYDCILKIHGELTQNIDSYSQVLMVSNIELLLNYCSRYYGRQFITRKSANLNLVSKVENILKGYFESEEKRNAGMPSVKDLANRVNLSPSYLSDLLKKETGLNAQDHIHYFVIEQAKNILLQTNQSVSEIAYSLGFEYPQYFSRLFKQKTGITPLEYRSLN